jgi:hypothetical protein
MGARRNVARAVLAAVSLAAAARSGASTLVEPIARLSFEGGYDSNALYDGQGGDTIGRISPDLGLRARDHLWDLSLTYGGDWIVYRERAPEGFWNHRARLTLDAHPTERLGVIAEGRFAYAYDPVGLALLGVFRSGQESALFGEGRARAVYRLTERFSAALTGAERVVVFQSQEGGAMHAVTAEGIWRATHRLQLGADYRLSAFQTFLGPGTTELSFAHGVHATAGYELSRHLRVDAAAGPAFWRGPTNAGIVPEARVSLSRGMRSTDLHVSVWHGLGIGTTAAPAVVSALEGGGAWRIGRRYAFHADAGLWKSGEAPTGANSTLGWAGSAEAALLLSRGLRLGLVGTYLARLDDPSPELRRATLGLRFGWELEAR